MRKQKMLMSIIGVIVVSMISVGTGISQTTTTPPITLDYGNIFLSGCDPIIPTGHFPQMWDLTACYMTISFTYNANGLVDDFGGGAHAWAELGIRAVGYSDFNPTSQVEGAGVWLATDYDWTANTFDPDPQGAPIQDLDDKLILQKGGGLGEGSYNLPSPPPNPWANHRVWFDRDGVNQWQAQSPLAVDGGTYNTAGYYDVVIALQATNSTSGNAYMTINELAQGFETDGNWNTMELSPAGMTFTGDMTQMQVFYGLYGYGATHTVAFNGVTVTGCLVLEEGLATGGGWFIPESNAKGLINLGKKATFAFVAKQKSGNSTGNLEFQYHGDGLNLKSTSYDWVTVASTQAMFEGIGNLNGEPGYKFRVRAVDGNQLGGGALDRFEIRIWTGNSDSYENPTYRAEGNLGGGQIVVHKK
jgi:hypothetical protein